jgi:hypothetical protein
MAPVPSIPVSDNPSLNSLVTHSALRTAQGFAVVAPPVYVVSSLILRRGRHPFSIRRLMATSVGSTLAGAGIGAGVGYVRLSNQGQLALDDRVLSLVSELTSWSSTDITQ